METRLSYALVGLFVLVLGGAFVAMSLWLMGVGPRGDYRTFAVYPSESVAGIAGESLVRFQGVDVGKVREVGVDPQDPRRVRLLIDVRRDLPIQVDTTARIASQGLTGLVYYIELEAGEPDSPLLETRPGDPYPVIRSDLSDFARLQETGTDLLERSKEAAGELRSVLVALNDLLGDEERGLIRTTIEDTSRAAARLSAAGETLDAELRRIGPLLDHLTAVLDRLAEQGGTALERVGEAAQATDQAARRVDRLATGAVPVVDSLSRDGMPELIALLRDLRGLTGRLDRIATDLEQDPNLLLYGRPRRPGPGERSR
ncbi:MAG: MlaD family protein [Chromatiaceae bacterium]|jgi:phospholipid/cholesterol/gamma-HCH transport system substrate-binding protein